MTEPVDKLRRELPIDAAAADFLETLPAKQRGKLITALLEAKQAQEQKVTGALEGAISFVPAPLRRQARKLLFD